MTNKSQWRTNLTRKARTVQKVLGMTDDDYHAMLGDRYGKSSTRDLSIPELKDLCAHLDYLSGTPAKDGKRPPNVDGQARKIWVLWQDLHRLGAVRDPSAGALNTFIKTRCRIKVDSYAWLNTYQANDVIEIIKKWIQRVEDQASTQAHG
ncbi:regulatory protein GemA [Pseudodesulfovibrio sp.]|uniref:regulatory protein GemA n=1 Tax=Pseudodesulfovibrio sp. TaxID=2035812 RepID=UPI002629278E|nr:regulatory protein GemA [Pseudodesulfovibrio sp.]MDD3310996.1 regulatory protein GemA [Pseudodesulfovibrio sp.]